MATITRELFDKIIDALKEKGITNENAWYEDSTTVFSYDTDMKTRDIAIEMRIPNALSFEQISVQDVREVAFKWLKGVPFLEKERRCLRSYIRKRWRKEWQCISDCRRVNGFCLR